MLGHRAILAPDLLSFHFPIEMKLKELRQPPYVPPEGQRLGDVEQAWKTLDREEHLQETALKTEMMRLEKLEQLAAKFHQKVGLRNSYLDEMIQVLSVSKMLKKKL